MAETHQEVVKVWIAPGCIVCDACEAECPEVFDVQEETCLIRPEAQSPDFTKPLTPSIIDAAEGCPVDVIKFETVEVEGPEPWAGQEEQKEAAAATAGGGGAAKSKGPAIPEGPPEPKWKGLLDAANVSASRSAGGPTVRITPSAKTPPEVVAAVLPDDAPPDAMAAAAVGSGYVARRRSLAERIKDKAERMASAAGTTRRGFGAIVLLAWGTMAGWFALLGAQFQDFLVPKVTKEPPSTFRAGTMADFPEPGVYEQHKGKNVWIVRLPDGQLVAVSTICTHLGCIPNWLQNDQKFKCPCHGSGFYMDGFNFEGPAPRPLERHKIFRDGENIFVDKSFIYRQELGQWTDPNSFITV